MNMTTALEAEVHDVREDAPRRRAAAATIVAGLYVLLVLGAPLIVRYGPDPELASAPAAVVVQDTAAPRCASAPEYGRSCPADDKVTLKALLPVALH